MHQQGGTLAAHDISVHRGADAILERVTLAITPGSRIGVVGPNGRGKTTLLRALAGLEELDRGSVTRNPPGLRVGYLPQERDVRRDETLLGYLERRTEEEATAEFEARAAAALRRVGLEAGLDRRVGELSGGEQSRAALASILLARFDVYLLDEPTNDLDFDGLELLERFLLRLDGGFVVVSHDREFLDRTVNRIVELESGTERVHQYTGGWSEYEAARERARSEHERAFAQWSDERARFGELHRDRREQARVGGKQADRRGTHALMSKTRAAARRVEWLERDRVEKPWQPWELQARPRSGRALRRSRRRAGGCGRRARAVPARAARLRRPVGRAALDRGPERERKDDADRRAARPGPARKRDAASRTVGRLRRDRTGALALRDGRAADPHLLR